MLHDPIVIASAVRTPMGGFQGAFSGLAAPQLGAVPQQILQALCGAAREVA